MLLSFIYPQDFLGLVEKLYYLSGRYEIQLTVGDVAMVCPPHIHPRVCPCSTANRAADF